LTNFESTTHALLRAGRADEAEQLLIKQVETDPGNPEPIKLLAGLLTNHGRWIQARQIIQETMDQRPEAAHLHKLLAEVLRAEGDLEAARTHYKAAWELEPGSGDIAMGFAGIQKNTHGEQLLAEIRGSIDNPQVDHEELSMLNFAAAKVADDMKKYGEAFEHYKVANALSDTSKSFVNYEQLFARSKLIYSKKFLKKMQGAGCSSRLPVFVVGMPRTGTTLLEQRLSRHPKVGGMGELPDISVLANSIGRTYSSAAVYPDSMRLMEPDHAREFGQRYVDKARNRIDDASLTRAVDKNPLNFLYSGLIMTVLPQARILHSVRHPLDTCLSCFFQPFGSDELGFTNSLDSCAAFYRLYRRSMRHWQSLFGSRILDVNYDDLVGDTDITLRRTASFIGLDWDDGCLQSEAESSTVRTASYWQARQPVYSSSRARWKNYEPYIGDLQDKLADFL